MSALNRLRHTAFHGFAAKAKKGGSADVGRHHTVLDYTYSRDRGDFYLGESLRSDTAVRFAVGHSGQEHVIVTARTRAGKGTAIIVPNVLKHKGSSLIVDPKGEAAQLAAHRLAEEGHEVAILDPFDVIARKLGYRLPYMAQFNPLAEIDIWSQDAPAELAELATLLIDDEGAKEKYWEKSARIFGAGVMAFALLQPPGRRNLIPMANLAFAPREALVEVMEAMAEYDGEGPPDLVRLIQRGGNFGLRYMQPGDATGFRSLTSILATCMMWIDCQGIANSLGGRLNNIRMSDLKNKDKFTVFVVIPEYRIESHGAWLRMVVNSAVNAISKTPKKPKLPVNVLIDEFGNLGNLPAVRRAFAIGAGQGARIVIVLQSFGQLEAHYKEVWEDFIANSVIVALSVNDRKTVDYLEHRSGVTDAENEEGKKLGQKVPVMTHSDISNFTNADRGNAILFPNGADPVRFLLDYYFESGVAGVDFDVHPDHADELDAYEFRRVVRSNQRKESGDRVAIGAAEPKLLTDRSG